MSKWCLWAKSGLFGLAACPPVFAWPHNFFHQNTMAKKKAPPKSNPCHVVGAVANAKARNVCSSYLKCKNMYGSNWKEQRLQGTVNKSHQKERQTGRQQWRIEASYEVIAGSFVTIDLPGNQVKAGGLSEPVPTPRTLVTPSPTALDPPVVQPVAINPCSVPILRRSRHQQPRQLQQPWNPQSWQRRLQPRPSSLLGRTIARSISTPMKID